MFDDNSSIASNSSLDSASDSLVDDVVLHSVLGEVQNQLNKFAGSGSAQSDLEQIYGVRNPVVIQNLLSDMSQGVSSLFSRIKILSDEAMKGAQGAYDSEQDTIYLAQSLVTGPGPVDLLAKVVIEMVAQKNIGKGMKNYLYKGENPREHNLPVIRINNRLPMLVTPFTSEDKESLYSLYSDPETAISGSNIDIILNRKYS